MLPRLMTLTEIAMLLYWALAAALVVGLIYIPPDYMYSDYENPLVVAWNWSFFPIDIAFALCGLWARFANLRPGLARNLSLIGATLMFCAGTMAISFWSVTGEFEPLWWGMNLWLVVLALWAIWSCLTQQE